MVVTEKFIDELLEHAGTIGKRERSKIGYRRDDRFVPVAIAVGPNGEQAVMAIGHKSYEQKKAIMFGLSQAAREEGALAIVIVADTRWARSDKFSDYFHIENPKNMGIEEWTKEYHSIVNGVYGGSLGNCPREVWDEAIVVSVKGPLIEPRIKLLKYREGERDTVEWLDGPIENEHELKVQINMLPDWWKEPNAKPA